MSMNCVAATPFGNKTCRQAYANACSPIRPCQLPPIPQMRWPAQRQLQRQSANELWSLPTMDALRARYAPVDRRKAARVARARARALLSPSPPSTMDANAPVRAEVLASASVELCAALLANLHRVVDSFRELDFNGDGRVERREFVRAARTMPALDRFRAVELAALFDSIDIDHNGSIEYAELHRLLREREDVSLAPELRTGACGAIELHAANAIELRGMRGADEVRQARAQLAAEQDAAATRLQAHIRRKWRRQPGGGALLPRAGAAQAMIQMRLMAVPLKLALQLQLRPWTKERTATSRKGASFTSSGVHWTGGKSDEQLVSSPST